MEDQAISLSPIPTTRGSILFNVSVEGGSVREKVNVKVGVVLVEIPPETQ
jgi:hypothetical protein